MDDKKPEAKKSEVAASAAASKPPLANPPKSKESQEPHPDAHKEYAGLPDMQLGSWHKPKAP